MTQIHRFAGQAAVHATTVYAVCGGSTKGAYSGNGPTASI